jgi:hypothetical protein
MDQDVTHPAGSKCHPSIRLHRGLGENDPSFGDGFSKKSLIAGIGRSLARQPAVRRRATMLESARNRTLFRGDRQTFGSR